MVQATRRSQQAAAVVAAHTQEVREQYDRKQAARGKAHAQKVRDQYDMQQASRGSHKDELLSQLERMVLQSTEPEGPYEQRARWSSPELQVPQVPAVAAVPDADTKSCVAVAASVVDDTWCQQSCNHNPPVCPEAMCTCAGGASPSPASGAKVAPGAAQKPSKAASLYRLLVSLKRAEAATGTTTSVTGAGSPVADAATLVADAGRFATTHGLRETGCKDDQLECASWAADEQCESNPDFMMTSCSFSCTRCSEAPQFFGVLRSLSERKKLLHMRNRDVVYV